MSIRLMSNPILNKFYVFFWNRLWREDRARQQVIQQPTFKIIVKEIDDEICWRRGRRWANKQLSDCYVSHCVGRQPFCLGQWESSVLGSHFVLDQSESSILVPSIVTTNQRTEVEQEPIGGGQGDRYTSQGPVLRLDVFRCGSISSTYPCQSVEVYFPK